MLEFYRQKSEEQWNLCYEAQEREDMALATKHQKEASNYDSMIQTERNRLINAERKEGGA